MKKLALLVLLLPIFARAQYTRLTPDFSLQNAQGQAISGASVYILTQPANTQSFTPLATIYGSPTGSGTAICGGSAGQISNPLTTDGFGHTCAYGTPGIYTVCYVSPYTGTQCYADQTLGGSGGSAVVSPPAQSVQLANSGANGLTSDPSITINTVGHAICSPTNPGNLMCYGAKPDSRNCYDFVATQGSSTITSATCNFTAADTGKTIALQAGQVGIASAVLGSTVSTGVTGSTGQTCAVTGFNGGGSGASGFIYLTAANTITASSSAVIYTTPNFGTGYTGTVNSATLSTGGPNPAASCSGSITLSSAATFSQSLLTTISFVNSTTATLGTNALSSVTGARGTLGTNNLTAVQNWVNACIAAGQVTRCYAPAGHYLINGTVTVPSSITLEGDGVYPIWGVGGAFNTLIPATDPFLNGSIFIEAGGLGVDAFDVTATGTGINVWNLGVTFDVADSFISTGNAFNFTSNLTQGGFPQWGIVSSRIDNTAVWGTDGNHNSHIITNAQDVTMIANKSWGGGGLLWLTNTFICCTGNSKIDQYVGSMFTGGTAAGISFLNASTTTQSNNLMSTDRLNAGAIALSNSALTGTILHSWIVPPIDGNSQHTGFFDNNQRTWTDIADDFENLNVIYPNRPNTNPDFAKIGGQSGYSFVGQWFCCAQNFGSGNAAPGHLFNMLNHGVTEAGATFQEVQNLNATAILADFMIPLGSAGEQSTIALGQSLSNGNSFDIGMNWQGSNAANSSAIFNFYGDQVNQLQFWPKGDLCIKCNGTEEPNYQLAADNAGTFPFNGAFKGTGNAVNSLTVPTLLIENDAANNISSLLAAFDSPNAVTGGITFLVSTIGADFVNQDDSLLFGLHYNAVGPTALNYGDIHLLNDSGAGQISIWPNGIGVNTKGTALTYPFQVNGTAQASNQVLTTAAPTVAAGQIGYGGTTVASSFCGSLAGAAGCIVVNIAGTIHYVPYY